MKHILLSILRNKNTNISQYRDASEKLGLILAQETSQFLEKKEETIETPIAKATGIKFKNNIILIPILRSGLVLMNSFLKFYENADVGFVGMKRDEKTAIAKLYYKNLPKISPTDDVIVLDPMIATGGSGTAALEILKEEGIQEDKIIFVAVIASQEGLDCIKNKFPKIKLTVVQTDKELNEQKFIVPGLGDFGDRYFGTL